MTQQEIQERNKQIALMLGWKCLSPKTKYSYWTYPLEKSFVYKLGCPVHYKNFMFHSDWNWLMEAVDFIESIEVDDFGYIVEMSPPSSRIYLAKNNFSIISIGPKSSRKEAVFIAVSDFAKLYNNKEL